MAEQVQQKKPNIAQRLTRFFKDVYSELKKVIWPSRNQVISNTLTVLITCVLVGGVVWLLDLLFGYLYTLIFA